MTERFAAPLSRAAGITLIGVTEHTYDDQLAGIGGYGWRLSTTTEFDVRHRELLAGPPGY